MTSTAFLSLFCVFLFFFSTVFRRIAHQWYKISDHCTSSTLLLLLLIFSFSSICSAAVVCNLSATIWFVFILFTFIQTQTNSLTHTEETWIGVLNVILDACAMFGRKWLWSSTLDAQTLHSISNYSSIVTIAAQRATYCLTLIFRFELRALTHSHTNSLTCRTTNELI